jgi:hypothetical protein
MGLLPGESPAEFEQLYKKLIDEFVPRGPLEEDIVSTISRLLWRKKNLSTFRAAELARQRRRQIIEDEKARRNIPHDTSRLLSIYGDEDDEVQAAREDAVRAGEQQARDELGEYYKLTEHDYHATALIEDLGVEERLDGAIDKCVKRLLMVRGVKSMSVEAHSQPVQLSKPRATNRPAA